MLIVAQIGYKMTTKVLIFIIITNVNTHLCIITPYIRKNNKKHFKT